MPWNLRRTRRFFITPPTGPAIAQTPGVPDSTPQGGVPTPVASLSVAPTSGTLAIGATLALTATPRSAAGVVLTGRVVTYASSASGVAAVDSTGVVTAVTAGSATITATCEGVNGTQATSVTVSPAMTGVRYPDLPAMTDALEVVGLEPTPVKLADGTWQTLLALRSKVGGPLTTLSARTGSKKRFHVVRRDGSGNYKWTTPVTVTFSDASLSAMIGTTEDHGRQIATARGDLRGTTPGVYTMTVTCDGASVQVYVVIDLHPSRKAAPPAQYANTRWPKPSADAPVTHLTTAAQLTAAFAAPVAGHVYAIAAGLYSTTTNDTINVPSGTANGLTYFVSEMMFADWTRAARRLTLAEEATLPNLEINADAYARLQTGGGVTDVVLADVRVTRGPSNPGFTYSLLQIGDYNATTLAASAQNVWLTRVAVRFVPFPIISESVVLAAPAPSRNATTGDITVTVHATPQQFPAAVGNNVLFRKPGAPAVGLSQPYIPLSSQYNSYGNYPHALNAVTVNADGTQTLVFNGNGDGNWLDYTQMPGGACELRGPVTASVRRGTVLIGKHLVMSGCRSSEIHENDTHDSQDVAVWGGPGPFDIGNCVLASDSTEPIAAGGYAVADPSLAPADIHIHRVYKTNRGRGSRSNANSPYTGGGPFMQKVGFVECKVGQRIDIEDCVVDGCPTGWDGQDGSAFEFKTDPYQSYHGPEMVTSDACVSYVLASRMSNLASLTPLSGQTGTDPIAAQRIEFVQIAGTALYTCNRNFAQGVLALNTINTATPPQSADDYRFAHLTYVAPQGPNVQRAIYFGSGAIQFGAPRFEACVLRAPTYDAYDNGPTSYTALFAYDSASGSTATLTANAPGAVVQDLLVLGGDRLQDTSALTVTGDANHLVPDANPFTGDPQSGVLTDLVLTGTAATYRAHDGTPLGANIADLTARTAGVIDTDVVDGW